MAFATMSRQTKRAKKKNSGGKGLKHKSHKWEGVTCNKPLGAAFGIYQSL